MFGVDLKKYFSEVRKYLTSYKFEVSPFGLYLPKAHAFVRGNYEHWVKGYESEKAVDHNIIPNEGLNHFLNVVLKGPSGAGTQITSWYLMLHSGTGTPDASLTASNYNASLTEITSGSNGYSEATRVLWVGDAVDTVNTEVVNNTTPASFTIVTPGTLQVNGAGLVSVSTKGSQAGTLLSAGKFSATRTLSDTDQFQLKYKVDLDAA